MHAVIVTGGRSYPYPQVVHHALDAELAKYGSFVLYHGACTDKETGEMTGADRYADDWGRQYPDDVVEVEPVPADWRWGVRGGPIRNRKMVNMAVLRIPRRENIHGLVFPEPGSRGTWNCKGIMEDFHIKVDIWTPARVNAWLAEQAKAR